MATIYALPSHQIGEVVLREGIRTIVQMIRTSVQIGQAQSAAGIRPLATGRFIPGPSKARIRNDACVNSYGALRAEIVTKKSRPIGSIVKDAPVGANSARICSSR
jgi:hypothetical protein